MDRLVFVVVTLALLFATQVQADVWFDENCVESRSIVASVQPAASAPAKAASGASRDGKAALVSARPQRAGVAGPDWLAPLLSTFQVPGGIPLKLDFLKP